MTSVAVIDPQPAVRAGLVMLLRAEPGMVPVGTAAGSADAHELIARERPDVVLLEHRLIEGDGIALCRRVKAERPSARVVLYTALPDPGVELWRASPAPTGWSTRPRPRPTCSRRSGWWRAARPRCRR